MPVACYPSVHPTSPVLKTTDYNHNKQHGCSRMYTIPDVVVIPYLCGSKISYWQVNAIYTTLLCDLNYSCKEICGLYTIIYVAILHLF